MQNFIGLLIILLVAFPIGSLLGIDGTVTFMFIIAGLGIYYAYKEFM